MNNNFVAHLSKITAKACVEEIETLYNLLLGTLEYYDINFNLFCRITYSRFDHSYLTAVFLLQGFSNLET